MTCEQKVKDQIWCITLPLEVWKRLKELYEPLNTSTQFDHLSSIWNTSLSDYSSITEYCSALEIATSNFLVSGAAEFPHFDSHVLMLIALMGLPPSCSPEKARHQTGWPMPFRPRNRMKRSTEGGNQGLLKKRHDMQNGSKLHNAGIANKLAMWKRPAP